MIIDIYARLSAIASASLARLGLGLLVFQVSAQASDLDKEYTKNYTDCQIFTDAVRQKNTEIVAHKIDVMINWIDKLNRYQSDRGRPTFDLTSTPDLRLMLFKRVFNMCLEDPTGEVSDKTVTIYKMNAAINGVVIPNNG